MEIHIYSDESGVFDQTHNNTFVFGGLLFLCPEESQHAARRYLQAESVIRNKYRIPPESELKACILKNEARGKLFRSLNPFHKFGVVVRQRQVLANIFDNKKSKQRYLDYVFKIAVKRKLEKLIKEGEIDPNSVSKIRFYADEHTTATDGCYELREALEREFKIGTFNQKWSKFYPPIFPNLISVELKFCDSKVKPLIRGADIVANKIYHAAEIGDVVSLQNIRHTFIITQP